MLTRDDAYMEIVKNKFLAFSLFPKNVYNCTLQGFIISLLASKIKTNFRKRKEKMFSPSKRGIRYN
jgi:hypothetical protein